MANHFHVILRNRPDVVEGWSDAGVARRWWQLCPARKTDEGLPEEPTEAELRAISGNPQRLSEIRRRLSDISWFMRLAAEPVARRSNAEEGCLGRFWQGRFKAVKLCDEAALLACSVYVDLNPLRAGCCATPEASEHTSARRRIDELSPVVAEPSESAGGRTPADWLAPLELNERGPACAAPNLRGPRASDKGFLPLPLDRYLDLLDWTGRQALLGKKGIVPEHLAPILERVGIPAATWLELSLGFGKLFHRVAGSPVSIARESARGRRTYRAPGARLLGASQVRRQ